MGSSSVLKQLGAFARLSNTSPYILNNGVELLHSIFKEPKPLFSSTEEKSKALNFLGTSLNVDKRQLAQKVRSGLEFLVDELLELEKTVTESENKIKHITSWDSIKSVEEFIKNTIDMEPEHITPEPQDLTVIPSSHVWWFYVDEDDD